MKVFKTNIIDVMLLQPEVFSDNRGIFYEAFNERVFADIQQLGLEFRVCQINQSISKKGTLRGLHYQKEPCAQAKIVKVTRGSITDFFLDIREDSPTYGKFGKVLLNAGSECLYIPKGCAHGFLAMENNTEIMYLCDEFYNPEMEAGYNFFGCPDLKILKLDGTPYIQSEKDAILPAFSFISKGSST